MLPFPPSLSPPLLSLVSPIGAISHKPFSIPHLYHPICPQGYIYILLLVAHHHTIPINISLPLSSSSPSLPCHPGTMAGQKSSSSDSPLHNLSSNIKTSLSKVILKFSRTSPIKE